MTVNGSQMDSLLDEPAVTLQKISVTYDGEDILDDITVSFPRSACTVIMGPSGSGKSTLLRAAAGLIVPDHGTVELLGANLAHISDRDLERLRSRNGFVFQDAALWQNLSLYQNLSLPVEFHEPRVDATAIGERIERLMRELGGTQRLDLRPAAVSAGERKIISFARALIADPELVFLDEPTGSIDGERVDLMIRKLRTLKDRKITLIAVTHNARIASQLADFVLVIKAGKILKFGSLSEISRTEDPEIKRILTDVLSETATYDGDILELLDPDANSYLL